MAATIVDNTNIEPRQDRGTGWSKNLFASRGMIYVTMKELDGRGVMMFQVQETFNHWDLETAQLLFDSL